MYISRDDGGQWRWYGVTRTGIFTLVAQPGNTRLLLSAGAYTVLRDHLIHCPLACMLRDVSSCVDTDVAREKRVRGMLAPQISQVSGDITSGRTSACRRKEVRDDIGLDPALDANTVGPVERRRQG